MGQTPEGVQQNIAMQQLAGMPPAGYAPQPLTQQQQYQQALAQHLMQNGGLYPTTANLQSTHNDSFQRQALPTQQQALPAAATAPVMSPHEAVRLSQQSIADPQAGPQPAPQAGAASPPNAKQEGPPPPPPELIALQQADKWLGASMGSESSTLYDPLTFAKSVNSVSDGNYNNLTPKAGEGAKQGLFGWVLGLPGQAWNLLTGLWPFGKKEQSMSSFNIS